MNCNRQRDILAEKLLYTAFQFSVIIKMFIIRILNAACADGICGEKKALPAMNLLMH